MLTGTPLQGQVALVTGGGSGIGYAIAKALLGAGAKVVICGRNEEKLHHAAQTLGEAGPVQAYRCDIRNLDEVQVLADRIEASAGVLLRGTGQARCGLPAAAVREALAHRHLTRSRQPGPPHRHGPPGPWRATRYPCGPSLPQLLPLDSGGPSDRDDRRRFCAFLPQPGASGSVHRPRKKLTHLFVGKLDAGY